MKYARRLERTDGPAGRPAATLEIVKARDLSRACSFARTDFPPRSRDESRDRPSLPKQLGACSRMHYHHGTRGTAEGRFFFRMKSDSGQFVHLSLSLCLSHDLRPSLCGVCALRARAAFYFKANARIQSPKLPIRLTLRRETCGARVLRLIINFTNGNYILRHQISRR